MLYILFNTDMDVDNIINALEEKGFTNSGYGPKRDDAIGVCTTTMTHKYTLLSKHMTSSDPHISWVHCRKQCLSEEEFIKGLDNYEVPLTDNQ